MRYLIDDTMFKPNGPIFVYLCGEAACGYIPGFVKTLAAENNATIVL